MCRATLVGKAPVNDAPDGALTLDARATTTAQIKATANPRQAERIFEPPEEEPFPLPFGKTLWYTFGGNGPEMVVDTAGSDFDTVLGIYTADVEPLACSDDVPHDTGGFTLQAAAAIPTVEGETYLVQVGGFGLFVEDDFEQTAEFGRVRIEVR
jgi:hypothetical protein